MADLKLSEELDFEKPILELERKIQELDSRMQAGEEGLEHEIKQLREKRDKETKRVFADLTPWQRVQLSRHSQRPTTMDYVEHMLDSWTELHGDRAFGDDPAMLTALGYLGKRRVMMIGHRKGKNLRERIDCNFGCAHPEGYRKALQKMKMAEKFGLPIVTLINTPGAYPGIGAEERGQAMAIAVNIQEMALLRVPIVCVVIGEGGSGGALGIGVGDRVYVMQYAYYSVISPEGCASILWKDAGRASEAATALKLTADDLIGLDLIDGRIDEPLGGAHRNPAETLKVVRAQIESALDDICDKPIDDLLEERYARIRTFGKYNEVAV